MSSTANRPLSAEERELALWMLEHGSPEAHSFISQLELAEVTPWRCQCGCASINLQLKGHLETPGGVHILGDFCFGRGDNLAGIFIFSSDGLLKGIEVYGLAADAPKVLPNPGSLRPLSRANF